MGDLREQFEKAAGSISSGDVGGSASRDEQLELYALYSVVKKGTAPAKAPSAVFDPVGFAKWTAWASLKYMCVDEAMLKYTALVAAIASRSPSPTAANARRAKDDSDAAGFGNKASTGFDICDEEIEDEYAHRAAVCTTGDSEDGASESQADICHWATVGDTQRVRDCLRGGVGKRKTDVDFRDAQGLTPLMRAADRGEIAVVQVLHVAGADMNLTDGDGLTALHYAVYCEHADVVAYLVGRCGASTTIRDADGLTAVEAASEHMRRVLEVAVAEAEADVGKASSWKCLGVSCVSTRCVSALETAVRFVGGGDALTAYVAVAAACAVGTVVIAWTWGSRNQ